MDKYKYHNEGLLSWIDICNYSIDSFLNIIERDFNY